MLSGRQTLSIISLLALLLVGTAVSSWAQNLGCPIHCGPAPSQPNVYLLVPSGDSNTIPIYQGFRNQTTVESKHTLFHTLEYSSNGLSRTIERLINDKSTGGVAVILPDDAPPPIAVERAYGLFPVVIVKPAAIERVGAVLVGKTLVPMVEEENPVKLGHYANDLIMKDWGVRKIKDSEAYMRDKAFLDFLKQYNTNILRKATTEDK